MNKSDVVAVSDIGKWLPDDWTGEVSDLLTVPVVSHYDAIQLASAAASILDASAGNECAHRDLLVALMNYGCIPSVTIDGVSALPSHPLGFVTNETLLRCWRCFVTDQYADVPPPSYVSSAIDGVSGESQIAAVRVVYRAYRSGARAAMDAFSLFYAVLSASLISINPDLTRAAWATHVLSANREVARTALAKYMQSEGANG